MEEELVADKLARHGVPVQLDERVVLVNEQVFYKHQKVDLEDLEERLAEPTFSLSAKFYPRQDPAKTYARLAPGTFREGPPFKTATKAELRAIIARLTKQTTSTAEREKVTTNEREVYESSDTTKNKKRPNTREDRKDNKKGKENAEDPKRGNTRESSRKVHFT